MTKLEDLGVEQVVLMLQSSQLPEFVDFVREKQVDGRRLQDVTEGLVKLWRPKINAKKFMSFIGDLKANPHKYFGEIPKETREIPVECQYQTVRKTKVESSSHSVVAVEELLKKLVPAKSFLYRNRQKPSERTPSYLPMDGAAKKQSRKFFRLSSYEYPNLDILSRFSKSENHEDRGYYAVKTNSRYFLTKPFKKHDARTKYKSLPASEEAFDKLAEDHFYEDLCYNDVAKCEVNEASSLNHPVNVKPCLVKLQELFNSFKKPFFKRPMQVQPSNDDVKITETPKDKESENNLYENADLVGNMYDSVNVTRKSDVGAIKSSTEPIVVEDYLEPITVNRDYCDVTMRQKEESLLGYIMNLFEHRFGIKKETSDPTHSEESDTDDKAEDKKARHEDDKMAADRIPHKMADRPLPVPVENEPYYMNVDRCEAENLLRGQPDGTFVLRPSSQSNHAYTLSVSCAGAVHNVGVRRRPDGRLALGFARRGERSFSSVPSLLRHHRRRRLLLVAAGGVLGATTLADTPHYYQTPTSLPVLT